MEMPMQMNLAAAAAHVEERSPFELLDLIDDCLLRIFEEFRLQHLLAASHVCQRFRELTQKVFSAKFSNFFINNYIRWPVVRLYELFDVFGPYMKIMKIKHAPTSKFHLELVQTYCRNLKVLRLTFVDLTHIKNWTQNFESLHELIIIECKARTENIEMLMSLCPNLKRCRVKCSILNEDIMVHCGRVPIDYNTFNYAGVAGSVVEHFKQFLQNHHTTQSFDLYREPYDSSFAVNRFCFKWRLNEEGAD